MKKMLIFSSLASAIAIAAASPAQAGTCPTVGADTDCAYLITINANGTITAGPVPSQPQTYDGADDTLVGVINNSSSPLTSLSLSGSGIFGFESDGEAAYTGHSYGPTGYEGPNTSFTFSNSDTGTVNFLNGGVAGNGGTAWFTLEENLANVQGGVTVRSGVPEPATWGMMLLGFAGIGAATRMRKKRQLATA